MNAVSAGAIDPLPRGKHSSPVSRTAGGRLGGGPVVPRSLPGPRYAEPYREPSTRTRLGQGADEALGRSAGHRRSDVPASPAGPQMVTPSVPDETVTVLIPWLTFEAVMGGETGGTPAPGPAAPLPSPAPVGDVPAIAAPPNPRQLVGDIPAITAPVKPPAIGG